MNILNMVNPTVMHFLTFIRQRHSILHQTEASSATTSTNHKRRHVWRRYSDGIAQTSRYFRKFIRMEIVYIALKVKQHYNKYYIGVIDMILSGRQMIM